MKKQEILNKLEGTKMKLDKLEQRIMEIEEVKGYENEETFDYWLKNIEKIISSIDGLLEYSVLDLERTMALVECGWYGQEDAEKYAERDMKEVVSKLSKRLKEVNEMLEKAIN